MNRKILIIGQSQFGSLVDTYQYCLHLHGLVDFTYLCWDYGHTTPPSEGTRVILVSREGGKIARLARLIRCALHELMRSQYVLHVVVYFPGCSVLGIMSRHIPTVLDIRTGYVRGGKLRTWFHNTLLALESMFFGKISIISDGLRAQLRLPEAKCQVIPLGANLIDAGRKDFEGLRLLYIGTLQHRRIHESVHGFCLFYRGLQARAQATYEIVGSGSESDVEALQSEIERSDAESRVKYHGRVAHAELKPFLQRSNVGVAYIPLVPEFDNQPPTKIFEYLLAGMAVVATETAENRRLVCGDNGVLCRDTPESFRLALEQLYARRAGYDSAVIRKDTDRFTWAHITHNQLLPYWDSLITRAGDTR